MVGREEGAAEQRVEEADLCADLFDHIDDLLDFPADGVLDGAGGWGEACDLLCSDPPLLAGSDSGFSAPGSSLTADEDLAAAGLSVPTEDIPELEWLSTFVEDSFSAGSFGLDEAEDRREGKDSRFRTSSPISVLDSTSSTTSSKEPGAAPLLCPHTLVPGRARSKRPRPATFLPRLPISLVSPTTSSSDETDPIASLPCRLVDSADLFELDSYVESQPWKKMAKSKKKKQPIVDAADFDVEALPARKCTHCGIQKTPQWRAGPNGPKTLCNACGVRYKSGRLFPEYRPAASPTFVPAIHSNSHKKVLEMRNKMGHKDPAPVPFFVRKAIHCSSSVNGGTNRPSLED